ncbi:MULTISPECIES: hypothetical protein [unclassified Moorena]|uniref:hypothetical protein n=1 Tax=unclassified Moorena TaxID=2683338 RepID=UPI0013FFC5EB|nr:MULTISPECIES: hypothetical protein [unclassified Moorena]NEO15037.1 hypothetical protein [Moorena sp. SIO3E8]NEQ04197.1 hypothetical protein [Moorena sp. SIO3F7]
MGRWGDGVYHTYEVDASFLPRFPIPDSRLPIPDSRFPTPDSREQKPLRFRVFFLHGQTFIKKN